MDEHPFGMYEHHFGLTGEPFGLTPDPAALYLSPAHAETLAALKIGLRSRRGLVVVTGEVGTGKTTLLYAFLSEHAVRLHTAYIANTNLKFDEMLRLALIDFGVSCEISERVALIQALNTFLRQCAEEGDSAALVIDEAQNLTVETLENLRLLLNFETFTDKLLQIVLVGQPELDVKLMRPALRQVSERIAVRSRIRPLTRDETREYIEHRLQRVGGTLDVFSPEALRLIVRWSGGIPRRVNILCHNALLFAYGCAEHRVTRRVVRAAARQQSARGRGSTMRMFAAQRSWLRPTLAALGVLAAVGVAAAMPWNDMPIWRHLAPTVPRASVSRLDASAPSAHTVSSLSEAQLHRFTDCEAEACSGWTPRLSVETTYGGADLSAYSPQRSTTAPRDASATSCPTLSLETRYGQTQMESGAPCNALGAASGGSRLPRDESAVGKARL